ERDGRAGAIHLEDARERVAADGQLAGARSLDGQVLVKDKVSAGQGDGLAVEARIEGDGVAALGVVVDFVAEGAELVDAAVQVVGDSPRAGQPAALERLQPRPESGPWTAVHSRSG